jgi:hypothetical protein
MDIPRDDVLLRLRPGIRDLVELVEGQSGLQVRFATLPVAAHVVATYGFDPHTNVATVSLASGWEDVDVAHEITHMQLELLEGFGVLAWRQGVQITPSLDAAMREIRTLPDDEVVHARLVAAGLKLDGEVLKPQVFDDRCKTVPNNLRAARSLRNDGMAHCDAFGFGDFYRASLFVQVQLIREKHAATLSAARLAVLDDFIECFRRSRPRQHRKATAILGLFGEHNVQTLDGHAEILCQLSRMEKVDEYMGLSSYRKQGGKYILPWP